VFLEYAFAHQVERGVDAVCRPWWQQGVGLLLLDDRATVFQ